MKKNEKRTNKQVQRIATGVERRRRENAKKTADEMLSNVEKK